MTSDETSSTRLDTTYPALSGNKIPSSNASLQSKEVVQRSGNDVEKAIPRANREEEPNPRVDHQDQAQVPIGMNPSAPPDGGFQAWLAVTKHFVEQPC
ncbi:hypothetical protein E2P81_ATG00040 [Venturia nashicola]|uniref:Uncharacterized protein n=1 Tax=Venturia nashicola TaxID=86259 RepID=A0A4Z1PSL4_9PEZI|nr:hypothetical protein E6O75_ATG00045 [Venturia nashicola]TLD39053.1 hypothetical protein E2P81_ATG00040 [Venturia nashicola]